MLAITVQLPDDGEMLVRVWDDGHVDVDQRVVGARVRVWTPIELLGGSFTIERTGAAAVQV